MGGSYLLGGLGTLLIGFDATMGSNWWERGVLCVMDPAGVTPHCQCVSRLDVRNKECWTSLMERLGGHSKEPCIDIVVMMD